MKVGEVRAEWELWLVARKLGFQEDIVWSDWESFDDYLDKLL